MVQHELPRNLRDFQAFNQARCPKRCQIKQLCARHNIIIFFAPANDHRSICLVELHIQTVKRRLGCMKLDSTQMLFDIKWALSQIT